MKGNYKLLPNVIVYLNSVRCGLVLSTQWVLAPSEVSSLMNS